MEAVIRRLRLALAIGCASTLLLVAAGCGASSSSATSQAAQEAQAEEQAERQAEREAQRKQLKAEQKRQARVAKWRRKHARLRSDLSMAADTIY